MRLRLRRRLSRRRSGNGLGCPGFRGDVGEVRLRREVFELGFGREVPQLRFRREVRELRLRRKFSGFRGEIRRLRLGGQVSQLRPVRQRSLLRGFGSRRGLLEDLWRKAGLIYRGVVYGVDLPQCHFLR